MYQVANLYLWYVYFEPKPPYFTWMWSWRLWRGSCLWRHKVSNGTSPHSEFQHVGSQGIDFDPPKHRENEITQEDEDEEEYIAHVGDFRLSSEYVEERHGGPRIWIGGSADSTKPWPCSRHKRCKFCYPVYEKFCNFLPCSRLKNAHEISGNYVIEGEERRRFVGKTLLKVRMKRTQGTVKLAANT